MEDVVRFLRKNTKKIGAVALSAGLGVSAAAGLPLLEDSNDGQPVEDVAQQEDDQDEVSTQIDQRQQRLETVSSDGEEDMDYTRLSC